MPLDANYHVSVWDDPVPTYLCLRCPTRGLSKAEAEAHVQEAHNEAPVPSVAMANLEAMRAAADAQAQEPPHA